MKSITEILGGAQLLLGVSFDLQDSFEEYLSEAQRAFLVIRGRGRIPYDDQPFFRAAIGKSFLQIPARQAVWEVDISESLWPNYANAA